MTVLSCILIVIAALLIIRYDDKKMWIAILLAFLSGAVAVYVPGVTP